MTPAEAKDNFDQTGPYLPSESNNAKLEGTTAEIRGELSGTVARMKGKTKAKEEIAAGGELFTLPPSLRPPAAAVISLIGETEAGTPTAASLKIATTGKITLGVALAAKSTLNFDGVTFSLT